MIWNSSCRRPEYGRLNYLERGRATCLRRTPGPQLHLSLLARMSVSVCNSNGGKSKTRNRDAASIDTDREERISARYSSQLTIECFQICVKQFDRSIRKLGILTTTVVRIVPPFDKTSLFHFVKPARCCRGCHAGDDVEA